MNTSTVVRVVEGCTHARLGQSIIATHKPPDASGGAAGFGFFVCGGGGGGRKEEGMGG